MSDTERLLRLRIAELERAVAALSQLADPAPAKSLPPSYSAIAGRDYGVQQMQRIERNA